MPLDTAWPDLLAQREQWKASGKVVVWTNGCFDILHAAHVRILQQAKAFGDILVVGVNTDASVRLLKGSQRPVIPEQERVELLAALRCVDHVVLFDETTPEHAIERLKPDVHCKGSEYRPPDGKPIPEAPLVESYGGVIRYFEMVPGYSTTGIIERIQHG